MSNEHDKPEFHDSYSGLKGMRRLGANYVWLLYSGFFFIEPILRENWHYFWRCMAVYAVFLPTYIWYVETKKPELRFPLVSVIFLLGVTTLPWNDGSTFFYIFAAALIPFAVRRMGIAIGFLAMELVALGIEWVRFYGNGLSNSINLGICAGMILAVGLGNLFVAEQKRSQCKLEKAREENHALAQVAERERIARDLHDVLGHTLSVIVLKAELAGRLMGRDDARAAAEIAEVEKTARTALAEVREAIGGYRAKGLQAEVDMARMTLDAAGVRLTCETMPPTLKAREETALSLSVREAVTNIVRHAQATECTMRFTVSADGFTTLEVEDNGRKTVVREGNGLRGMRARVEELGGRFRIERAAVQGTRLVIELPGTSVALAGEA
jgi:two-component system sensor histidine kinase DesK